MAGVLTAGTLAFYYFANNQSVSGPAGRSSTREDSVRREQALRSAAQAAPADPQAQLTLIRFLLNGRRAYEALDVARAATRANPDSLPLHLVQAELLAATGRLPEAADALLEFRKHPEAVVARASYLLRDGNRGAAVQLLRSLKGISPEVSLQAAQAALDALEPQLALKIVQPALEVRRDDLELRTSAGLAQLVLGRYTEAAATLAPAVERAPQLPVLRYYLGSALRLSGDLKRLQEAEEHLRHATEGAPREALFHYELALARVQLRAWPEARAAMVRCVELQPDLPEAQRDLARIYERLDPPDTLGAGLARARYLLLMQDPRSAASSLAALQHQFPDETKIALLAALAHHQAGDTEQLVALLTRLQRQRPKDAEVAQELFRAQRAAKSYDAALSTLETAATSGEEAPELLAEKSDLLQTLGRYEEAEGILASLRDREPENASRHYDLGLFLTLWSKRTDRVQAAERELHEALRLQPDFVGPHYRLGLLYESTGRPQEAVRHLSRAHELAPELWEALRPLGRAYSRLGDTARANECFRVFRRYQAREEVRNRLDLLNSRGRATRATRRELFRFYISTGATGPATRELETLAHLDPRDREAREQLVRYYGHARRFQRQFEERLAVEIPRKAAK